MIEHTLDSTHSILYVRPKSKLEQGDFVLLAKTVDREPFSFCARSSQAHQEDRRCNRFPPGECR
jgi:hypothetical protein